jgi:ABC-type multidrug transport system fused ATPase/permease subunit
MAVRPATPVQPAGPVQPAQDPAALRAEHDALAARLAVRTSVDEVQRGGVLTFFTVIALGMSIKFAWDRWGWLAVNTPRPPPGYPLWFLLAALVTLVLLAVAVRAFRRAAALRRQEDSLFARMRELRARLELDT